MLKPWVTTLDAPLSEAEITEIKHALGEFKSFAQSLPDEFSPGDLMGVSTEIIERGYAVRKAVCDSYVAANSRAFKRVTPFRRGVSEKPPLPKSLKDNLLQELGLKSIDDLLAVARELETGDKK